MYLFFYRNLKPSNILLKQDLSFQVSDFQVHSMADDELKLKIRIKESKSSAIIVSFN